MKKYKYVKYVKYALEETKNNRTPGQIKPELIKDTNWCISKTGNKQDLRRYKRTIRIFGKVANYKIEQQMKCKAAHSWIKYFGCGN